MPEITDNSIHKKSILLARNSPVALVVGAAGFLGSHLADRLLEKNIQVVGVDELSVSNKRNLQKASENRNFHMISQSPEQLDLDLPRLDYIFLVPIGKTNLTRVFELFKKTKCRMLLISSIVLYGKSNKELAYLKDIEEKLAGFAGEHRLNARIIRLGPIFGPRMDFDTPDPLIRLIHQALRGDLQKDIPLDYSSRALFVDDALDLAIRTILAGSTAQKIFDGILPAPVKVSEIKQVLLDPVWYENRDFEPTELPPWTTPNFDKTQKFLNWHPRRKLIAGLKETLQYFKDNEIEVGEIEDKEQEQEQEQETEVDEEKQADLEAFKKGSEKILIKRVRPKLFFPLSKIYLLAVLLLFSYALIWPGLILGWGFYTYRNSLEEGVKNLEKGDLDKSLGKLGQSEQAITEIKSIYETFDPVRKGGFLKAQFEQGDSFLALASLSVSIAKNTALGIQALFNSLRAVTGEDTASPEPYFASAEINLSMAQEDLSRAQVLAGSDKIGIYRDLVKKAHTLSVLLPKLVGIGAGSKNYLILLQNNMELRPGGGFIGSFAKVTFEAGKLKKLDVDDIYAIDGQLSLHVEPPKEIKEDLDQVNWYLRDSNWEPDFPTAARQAEWFFAKETGERVEGTIALDISAVEGLLSVVGPLNLSDYNETITSDNLFAKAVTHAETGFFPGSQAKKSFLTALTAEVFNKIFFLPKQNWAGIVSSLGKSLDEKHIGIYLDDAKLFSYLTGEGWTQVMPRASDLNKNRDFLALVEANLGANKANYYLDRNYKLETVVGKEGDVKQRLRISYTNKSPSDAFPGGKYKNRLRVYLPFGTKLDRALWAESDITKNVTSFVDYGRSGYSVLLELAPKEQKTLVLDYSVPVKLEFKNGKAPYKLDIIKQAGLLKDPLEWSISYPINYQVVSGQTNKIGPQEQTISTDLSKDRSFEVEFSK